MKGLNGYGLISLLSVVNSILTKDVGTSWPRDKDGSVCGDPDPANHVSTLNGRQTSNPKEISGMCESCGAVFHSECKVKAVPCPRCVRKELQKKQKSFWRQLNMDENFEESCNMFELSYQNT
ncbi:hypothetical protein EK904_002486 [Melospiza melodia maxima]|nr:hypothetical protein EK904_002486 [Melospiza melodia maxima]